MVAAPGPRPQRRHSGAVRADGDLQPAGQALLRVEAAGGIGEAGVLGCDVDGRLRLGTWRPQREVHARVTSLRRRLLAPRPLRHDVQSCRAFGPRWGLDYVHRAVQVEGQVQAVWRRWGP